MVRQLLLPREGGGSLRRFLGIRRRLLRDQWNDPRPLRGPVPLFDFRRRDDAADLRDSLTPGRMRGLYGGWRASDDGVIGGFSRSRMAFHEGTDNDNGVEEGDDQPAAPPFLRWSGTLSTEINKQSHLARNVTRSGFAAILSPEYPLGAPLGNRYRALEICCRTDGRTYAVNLHVETYFPEDMYQGFIVGGEGQQPTGEDGLASDSNTTTDMDGEEGEDELPEKPVETLDVRTHLQHRRAFVHRHDPHNHPYSGHPPLGFQRFILPFKDFALTSRGRLRQTQRDLDGAVSIESIGFTLMDGKDCDFCFDLVSLRAVNLIEGEVVGTPEDEAREEEVEERLRPKKKKKKKKKDVDDEEESEAETEPSVGKP